MKLANVRCPITGDVSQMSIAPEGEFDEYDCPTCGRYRISGAMSLQLSGMPRRERLHTFTAAKSNAPSGEMPIITVREMSRAS